jgi:hypothetical protein
LEGYPSLPPNRTRKTDDFKAQPAPRRQQKKPCHNLLLWQGFHKMLLVGLERDSETNSNSNNIRRNHELRNLVHFCPIAPVLTAVIEARARLPEAIKASILAIIRTTRNKCTFIDNSPLSSRKQNRVGADGSVI